MEIGHRIKKARELAHLSQSGLANAMKVSRGLVGQWESHAKKPGRDNLFKIAKVTTVSVHYLMGEQTLDEIKIETESSDEVDLLRQYRQFGDVQKKNLRQLIGMSVEVRKQIEKHGSPLKGEEVT